MLVIDGPMLTLSLGPSIGTVDVQLCNNLMQSVDIYLYTDCLNFPPQPR